MYKTSESVKTIFEALTKFNSNFKGLTPNASNPYFKSMYISFDAIVGLRNELAAVGLVAMQSIGTAPDGVSATITTTIGHVSGEWIESDTLTVKPVKADPQGLGSVISYGKRYQLAAMLGIAEVVDDDGNNGSGLTNTPPSQATLNQGIQNAGKQQSAPQAPQNEPMMNEEQAQRMTGLIKSKGLTREKAIEICKGITGKSTANGLTHKECELVIKAYENYTA